MKKRRKRIETEQRHSAGVPGEQTENSKMTSQETYCYYYYFFIILRLKHNDETCGSVL